MDRYIGLDVHKESCTAVVLTAAGKRVKTQVLETNGAALVDFVKSIPRQRHLCMEEGTCSEWLYEVLKPHVNELVVIMPEKRDSSEPKDDGRDAFGCAEAIRRGTVKHEVYKKVEAVAGLREAVRAHRLLTSDVTRVKNRLAAVFRSRGLAHAGADLYGTETRKAWIARLPKNRQFLPTKLGAELDTLVALQGEAEEQLLTESARHPVVKLLQTAPGIGPVRAAVIVAIVVTPDRFRSIRQFRKYIGLGIVTVVSAQWKKKDGQLVEANKALPRGLNRKRNPWLKEVFKGAAHTVTGMPGHPLYKDYQRSVASGVDPDLAMLTLARRIAGAVLAMWKKQEVYDPAKQSQTKA